MIFNDIASKDGWPFEKSVNCQLIPFYQLIFAGICSTLCITQKLGSFAPHRTWRWNAYGVFIFAVTLPENAKVKV